MAKMTPITVELRFDEDQLEVLADMIASNLTEQKHPEIKGYDRTYSHNEPQEPEQEDKVDTDDITSQPKDDLSAWDAPGLENEIAESIEKGYDDDYEAIELHDLTNAELEQIISDNPFTSSLLKSKMVKDELVSLVEVGFAIDAGEFDHLLKDHLFVVMEALGKRDTVTTSWRKDDLQKAVKKAYEDVTSA